MRNIYGTCISGSFGVYPENKRQINRRLARDVSVGVVAPLVSVARNLVKELALLPKLEKDYE